MEKITNQLTFADIDPNYQAFIDKFKPKKTTDDCYTPENIYNAVLQFVIDEYGIDADNVVRPFWPGADYEQYDYPEDCCVVDNPPFSILTKICRTYVEHGIKFFLFAPYLTNFSVGRTIDITHVITGSSITYENGARVDTAFVTNLDNRYRCRTSVKLSDEIKRIDTENVKAGKKELPKYKFPNHVVTSAMMGYMAKYGVDFCVLKSDALFISRLDSMKAVRGKGIFGGGYLLSEKAAAEKAAAEKAAAEKAAAIEWQLSESEKQIIKHLGKEAEQ